MAEIGTFGLGRVELLPSSLSAVHGSGALAGVVAITPRAPADRLEVTAQAGGITRGGHTMAAGVSAPLGGGWGVSFAGQGDDDGTASPLSRFATCRRDAPITSSARGAPGAAAPACQRC